jgi:hypothetical protein
MYVKLAVLYIQNVIKYPLSDLKNIKIRKSFDQAPISKGKVYPCNTMHAKISATGKKK